MATANLNLFSSRCVVPQGPSLISTRMGMRMTFQKSDRRRGEKVCCARNTDKSIGIAKGEGGGVLDGVERKYSSASKAEEEVDVGLREGLAVAEATVVLGKEEETEGIEWKWPPWDTRLPQRYRMIGATSLAFVICNMDKISDIKSKHNP